ncbi:MAG: hypothetical protein ABGX04_16315 [Myxococcales bacterium]|nr:hypothetical protein [Myxococcales bacterium]HIK83906.1 hypothetical protein [Myxococcales bacterium]
MPIRTRLSVSNCSSSISRVIFLALILALSGCVGGAWKTTLEEDTPAAYYRFMREHGDSKYAVQARERLDFHKLKRNPSLSGFDAFRNEFPGSDLIVQLHPALEKPAFEMARAQGTSAAYREFLAGFTGGAFSNRAEGNAVYVESSGFGGDAALLASFSERYAESDFAAEAVRTVKAVAEKRAGQFDQIGLVLKIARGTPEANRVRKALVDRIQEMMERVGISLVEIPDVIPAGQASRYPAARLEVSHVEREVGRHVSAGELARPALLGETAIVLRDKPDGVVIASRTFNIRVEDKAHVPGTSVLFSAVSPKFWDEFFVPVARWRNNRSIRPALPLGRAIIDLDGVGDRVVVLFEDGDFELLGLADPLKPIRLAAYHRGEDYKKWTGIRILGDRVAIYGEEGLEIVRFTGTGPIAEKTWTRGQIGRVLSLTSLGDELVIVGAKGMQILDLETNTIRRVMRRVLKSVASAGDTLVFVDGESIYLSTLDLLAENRVVAQMKLGKTFGPNNVRVLEGAAIVTGPGGAIVIDVRNPAKPKALAKHLTRDVGDIVDATRVRGRVFLVGTRGLQVLNRSLTRVEETIDVGERNRVTVMGRHLVTSDDSGLQVVDATPWADAGVPAAAR